MTALGKASAPGLRRMVAVAEGLTASYAPALRLPREDGLEAAEVILIPSRGMTVAPSAAVLAAEVTAIDVACVAGEAVLPLRVTPPHWRVRIEPEPGSGGDGDRARGRSPHHADDTAVFWPVRPKP